MKKQDLIKLNKDELQTKLTDDQEALVNLRFQKALQQLEHPQKIKLIKREIAKVKTAIREYELGLRGN
jgi:large subunit ribosomal protein L29